MCLEMKILCVCKSKRTYPLVPVLYPKKKDFLALGSGLSLFCIKVDAKERQPHRLLGQGMWVWLKRS